MTQVTRKTQDGQNNAQKQARATMDITYEQRSRAIPTRSKSSTAGPGPTGSTPHIPNTQGNSGKSPSKTEVADATHQRQRTNAAQLYNQLPRTEISSVTHKVDECTSHISRPIHTRDVNSQSRQNLADTTETSSATTKCQLK
jgi:hypothetical protein